MNTTSILRHINALRCLRQLRTGRPVSRAEIARELGLTRSTVGNAMRVLLDAGLVTEIGDGDPESRIGRPGVRITLDRRGAYALGLDVGTRSLTCVLLDLQMGVVDRIAVPTGTDFRNPDAVFEKLVDLPGRLMARAKVPNAKVQGACIAVPGLVDRIGRVVNAPFLEWHDYPLREKLAARLSPDWTVGVRNDAVAFAAAERAVSSHVEPETLLLILLAEGVGSALVIDGKVMEGAHGYAGELGHTVVAANGRVEAFEVLAGAPAFVRHFGVDQPVDKGVAAMLGDLGDPEIERTLAEWADTLAIGLANTIHAFDPSRIILGGPLASLFPHVADTVVGLLRQRLIHGFAPPPITVTQFGADGAAIGAAAIVLELIFAMPDLELPTPPAAAAS